MNEKSPLHLFEGFGIELEYMLVNAETLSILPVSDQVLRAVAGTYVSDVECGEIAWSNELVLHVIELKTNGPAASLADLPQAFDSHIGRINTLLAPLGGRLMPSAMHPWMDPHRETHLWPHDDHAIYQAFNRIFQCQRHGWANLQSVHLNLPFADDAEFARLHAAIRLLLPIMPALSASSPILEGRLSAFLDTRLEMYRTNAQRIPAVTGQVIPEALFSRQEYEQVLLRRLYHDIAPYDPDKLLQHEWLNARGAIARFDRDAIEIRLLDIQECPLADLAICAAIVEILKALIAERWLDLHRQQAWPVEPLQTILLATIRDAEQAVIDNPDYLLAFAFPYGSCCTAGELWHYLLETTSLLSEPGPWVAPLRTILDRGSLARRLRMAVRPEPSHERLYAIYQTLCHCLATGTMFKN